MTKSRAIGFGSAVLSLAVLCTTACRTTSSAGRTSPTASAPSRQAYIAKVQRQFPRGLYVVGFGAGDTPEDAEANARVEAASTIRSEITANLKSLQTETGDGDQVTARHVVTDEIARKVETDAGAFIQPRPELTTELDGHYEAVAVASRSELDGKYGQDAERLLNKLMAAWDQASKQEHAPLQVVATAMCEARGYEKKLDQLDSERRLVAGHAAWTDAAAARRQQMAEFEARLHAMKISIVGAPDAPGVAEDLLKKLSGSGLAADLVKQPDCSTGGLVVQIALQQTCSNSMLGPRCEESLHANGNRCSANEELFAETSNAGVGLHANDPTLAAHAAFKKIDVAKFVASVASRVSSSIDGECH